MRDFPWLEALLIVALAIVLIVKPIKHQPEPAPQAAGVYELAQSR